MWCKTPELWLTFAHQSRRPWAAPPRPEGGQPTVTKTVTKYVYDFAEGNKDLKDLLGGKGANLAEMTNLGLPVPPGFTITTEACREYLAEGREPAGLAAEVAGHLAELERGIGRTLGD